MVADGVPAAGEICDLLGRNGARLFIGEVGGKLPCIYARIIELPRLLRSALHKLWTTKKTPRAPKDSG